jgi:acetyl esterase/lipase
LGGHTHLVCWLGKAWLPKGQLLTSSLLLINGFGPTNHPLDPKFSRKLQIMVYPVFQVFDFQTPSYQIPWTPIMPKDDVRAFIELGLWRQAGSGDGIYRLEQECEKDPEKLSKFLKWTDPELVPKHLFPKNFVKRERKALSTATNEGTTTSTDNPCYDLRLSPLLAEDLSNLPKAYIQACEFDLIRDDAIFYEKRLREGEVQDQVHDHRYKHN